MEPMAYDEDYGDDETEDQPLIQVKGAHPVVLAFPGREIQIAPLPDQPFVDEESSDKEVVQADAQTSNFVLGMYLQAWPQITTIPDMIALGNATLTLLEKRRKLLNRQYGRPSGQAADGTIFPIP